MKSVTENQEAVSTFDGFDKSETKKAAIRVFAEKYLAERPLEMVIDEWIQIDDWHDVHISEKDDEPGLYEVWVYPVMTEYGITATDTSDDTEYYEVKLDLPKRIGCAVCEFCVADKDSRFCFVCRVSEEAEDE